MLGGNQHCGKQEKPHLQLWHFIEVLVGVPAAPFPIQFPPNVPGKTAEDRTVPSL